MSRVIERKIEMKRRLAAKYDRLALVAGSIPKRKTYVYKAERYRRQAAEIEKQANAG